MPVASTTTGSTWTSTILATSARSAGGSRGAACCWHGREGQLFSRGRAKRDGRAPAGRAKQLGSCIQPSESSVHARRTLGACEHGPGQGDMGMHAAWACMHIGSVFELWGSAERQPISHPACSTHPPTRTHPHWATGRYEALPPHQEPVLQPHRQPGQAVDSGRRGGERA